MKENLMTIFIVQNVKNAQIVLEITFLNVKSVIYLWLAKTLSKNVTIIKIFIQKKFKNSFAITVIFAIQDQ
jgi:hypothetical protein